MVNKPKKSLGFYGNIVAAPVFKEIAQKIYTDTPVIDEVKLPTGNSKVIEGDYQKYYANVNKAHSKMPNVKGMPGMDAIALLENLGLKVNFRGSGKVKSQSIKAGDKLEKNKTITLQLS